MTWTISSNALTQAELLNNESLFSLGNGYLGIRGNFEEGYGEDSKSIRGTYINAFHDIIDISYGEKLFAFPDTQQKLLNVIDAQTVLIYLGDDEEMFSLFEGEVISFQRQLHLDQGYSERIVHYRSKLGKEVKISFRRLVSFVRRELFLTQITVEPVNFSGKVKMVSTVNGDVTNFVDKNDPRVASGHAKRLNVTKVEEQNGLSMVADRTYRSELDVACVTRHVVTAGEVSHQTTSSAIETTITFDLTEPVTVTKLNIYTDTYRHGQDVVNAGVSLQNEIQNVSVEALFQEQEAYLADFWKHADIVMEGDDALQEGIRFNLYSLLQSVGKDKYSNIAAKGLSGEGYEGHYFWDTEIYIFPVFLMTKPDVAKNLLRYRYSILDGARARAKEMGHSKGALFPWRTISGTECSSFFPAGTAQYHISGDVAYSYIQYYLVTKDVEFLKEFGAEVLFETARLWADVGHYDQGKFKIDAVTGPDEYTCIVNNNYYTNALAKHNMKWAANAYDVLANEAPEVLAELTGRLGLTEEERNEWKEAAEAMYLPYDEELGINPQDDSFLHKAVWDFDNTPEDKYPLLLHYHPLTLYRYQVCKQADTVLAHFLLEDEQDLQTINKSYHYYEGITTHDSSLSSCIFSIMAAKLGEQEKAYDYFIETARLDLDNTHGNTKDGLHMANMGGTWMAIVNGFGGLRVKESGLSLAPQMPSQWNRYQFRLQFQGREIEVAVSRDGVEISLLQGEELTFQLYGTDVTVTSGKVHQQPLQALNA